jgi:hypothetical protein
MMGFPEFSMKSIEGTDPEITNCQLSFSYAIAHDTKILDLPYRHSVE